MIFNGPLQLISKLSKRNWRSLAKRFFPSSQWLIHYKLEDLRYDIIAGFTVGLTLVPQCMAYAQMASVNPLYGLYSSFIGQFIYVLMGTAKDAAIGPSAIVSMMVGNFNAANPIIKTGDNTYSCIMAFMSGLVLLLVGVLKLGFIVNLFSIPVVSGFTCAAGFTIFASQLKPFFGLKDAPNASPAVFVKQIVNVFIRYEDIKSVDVIFGSTAIIFLVFGQYLPDVIERLLKILNRRKMADENNNNNTAGKLTPTQAIFMEYLRLVAASRNVIVFVFTTLAAYLLIKADPSFENRISIVRNIQPGLPSPRFPALNLMSTVVIDNLTNETATQILRQSSDVFIDLTISFVIMPLMIMLEMFAITKALGRKNGYRIDATNELIAIGLANVIQSFFQAFPVTAAVTRCALNDQCKVKTQLGSIISAIIVIIAISALTETFYYIPKAALAGIIMTAAYNLIDFGIVKPMWREYKPDVSIFFLTFFLCLFFDMAYGILICILVNMITFLRPVVRMALVVSHERHLSETDEVDAPGKRTTVVKLSHGMKYPSADKFLDRMSHIIARSDKHIVLDCQFFTGIDYTGLQALRSILLLAFRQNKHLIFTNMSNHLLKKVEKIGIDHWLYVDSVEEAVKHYNEVNDDSHHELQIEVVHHSNDSQAGEFMSRHRLSSVAQRVPNQDSSAFEETASIQPAGSSDFAGDEEEAIAIEEEAAVWIKKQEEILRHLSVQAYFYQDIPIYMGNVGREGREVHDNKRNSSDESDNDEPPVLLQTIKKGPLFARSFSATMADPVAYQQQLGFAPIIAKQNDNEAGLIRRIRFSNALQKSAREAKQASRKQRQSKTGSRLSIRSGILKEKAGPSDMQRNETSLSGSQQSFYSAKSGFDNPAYEMSPQDETSNIDKQDTTGL